MAGEPVFPLPRLSAGPGLGVVPGPPIKVYQLPELLPEPRPEPPAPPPLEVELSTLREEVAAWRAAAEAATVDDWQRLRRHALALRGAQDLAPAPPRLLPGLGRDLCRDTTAFLGIPGGSSIGRSYRSLGASCPWSVPPESGIADDPFGLMLSDRSRRGDARVGVVQLHRRAGWTLGAWWDRSADPRPGGAMAFAVPAEVGGYELLGCFSRLYPDEWGRVERWWASQGIAHPTFRH